MTTRDSSIDARLAPTPRRPLWNAATRDAGALALAFATTRVVLFLMGLRFNLVLDWMFLADPSELKAQLLETVYYFHAFPPGMNLLTGSLLKLSEAHVATLAHAVFMGAGLLLACSLRSLLVAVGVGRRAAFAAALGFSLLPQSLYFENLYLYDYPVPALLAYSALVFHGAVAAPTFRRWLWFFTLCAVLGWIRSALHMVWFIGLVLLSVLVVPRAARRSVALAALGPLVLLGSLYLKNYLVFGVFDAQSQSGGNFTLITTHHMPRPLRKQWVREGKISPFADMSFAAPPSDFLPYFESPLNPAYPHNQALERPTLHAPNYNHWFFLTVNDKRRADASYCLRERPWEYVHTVLVRSLPQAFSPSTRWHPRTGTPSSPHAAHRAVLGGYEDLYNRLVHGLPLRPYGLYVFFPVLLGFASVGAWRRLRREAEGNTPARADDRAAGALVLVCALQILYLIAITALLTYGENARYRYIVEPLIWVVSAAGLLELRAWVRARSVQQGGTRAASADAVAQGAPGG